MKTLSIFILSFFLSFPLHASKVLELYFRNDTDENVKVTSIQLKKASLLHSSAPNEETIKSGGERSFYIEHPEDDFVDISYVKLELDDYDSITFQINETEVSWYWKAVFGSQTVCPIQHFWVPRSDNPYFEFFTVGRGGGQTLKLDNNEYPPYYLYAFFLRKK